MNNLIPEKYKWLEKEPSPKILKEALRWVGTLEGKGTSNNPVIIAWAEELGGWIGQWYKQDSVPWCGLFMAFCAKRAGFRFGQKALSALEWANWGTQRDGAPMLGDVLVFRRAGGGHVGLYVCEDHEAYHVLGGNQKDQVCITRLPKKNLVTARHCTWINSQPENVRVVWVQESGSMTDRLS